MRSALGANTGLPTNVGVTEVRSSAGMQFHKGTGYVAGRHRYSQRDGIRSATASTQRQEHCFAHSHMITILTEQLTESGRKKRERPSERRSVAITHDDQENDFASYYNVVSPSYKQLLLREGDKIDELRRPSGAR
jgi:hypothetical protein